MRKAKPQGVIGSAECARRTGLTVRALRVYERAGLIEPQRGANDWRGYGQEELRRLNHIITLKSLGLSLREIRGVLSAPVPTSLKSILELQLRSWLTRQAATMQALKLVNAALERLAANHSLSIDDLCELARSADMNQALRIKAFRELVNETITPEQEREYMTYWATRPTEAATAMREFGERQRVLFTKLEALRVKGADPASPRVQAIMDRHRALMTETGVRKQIVELMEWNPTITRKFISVGERVRNRILNEEKALTDPSGKSLFGFFITALRASEPGRAFQQILDGAAALLEQKVAATSVDGQKLARRLKSLCRRFELGDPMVFVLSTAYIAKTEHDGEWHDLTASEQAPHRFLADALRGSVKSEA